MEEQNPTEKFIAAIENAAREFQDATGLVVIDIGVDLVKRPNYDFLRQDFSVNAVNPQKLKS